MAINLASMIDHTLLKPSATKEEIIKLCREAREYNFASVCVNPCYVTLAAKELKNTGVAVCTVVGFPLGANSSFIKAAEAQEAVKNGAREIDMVINVGALKSCDFDYVENDIKAVISASKIKPDIKVKIIIETCLLTEEEKIHVCKIVKNSGADYVKTSTGFSTGGATVNDIELMRKIVGPDMGVKASGGIRDLETAFSMIKAGATRIGTSSSVKIINELMSEKI